MTNNYTIQKVLVPIDFSETSKLALEYSSFFCEQFGSSLHLMHVVSAGSYDEVLPDIDPAARGKKLRDQITLKLNELADQYSSCNPNGVEVHLREGKPSRQIVEVAQKIKADLILMGTHGVSGFEEFFAGSNAYRVVTASTCPVLSVQEKAKGLSFKNIAMTFDSTPHTRDKVSEAVALAEKFDATIHMAAAVTEEHKDELPQYKLKVKQVEDYLKKRNIKYTTEFIEGDNFGKMSMDFAKKVNADLMVIVTDQEASTGLFMGPYAQQIVNHSKIPVLSVTPTEVVRGWSQSDLEGGYRPMYIYEIENDNN